MNSLISTLSAFISPTAVHLPAVPQITESHCGPAVLELALSFIGKKVAQEDVVTAAKVKKRIMKHGMLPSQLALAVEKLAPDVKFWFSHPATNEDLNALLHKYHWPVIVNWQGLFYDTLEEEMVHNPDGEHGHYSIVVDLDMAKDQIVISDPYPEYASKYRTFSFEWFETRWWDVDHIISKKNGKLHSWYTKRLMMVITPQDATFPAKIGMKTFEEFKMLKSKK